MPAKKASKKKKKPKDDKPVTPMTRNGDIVDYNQMSKDNLMISGQGSYAKLLTPLSGTVVFDGH